MMVYLRVWLQVTLILALTQHIAAKRMPTKATVTLQPSTVSFEPYWTASVGSGHALLGLRSDWQEQLARAHHEIGVESVRFHGVFDDDMGPVVTRNTDGTANYNFTMVDKV